MQSKQGSVAKIKMTVWEAFMALKASRTGRCQPRELAADRRGNPSRQHPDWFQLAGLLHDMVNVRHICGTPRMGGEEGTADGDCCSCLRGQGRILLDVSVSRHDDCRLTKVVLLASARALSGEKVGVAKPQRVKRLLVHDGRKSLKCCSKKWRPRRNRLLGNKGSR